MRLALALAVVALGCGKTDHAVYFDTPPHVAWRIDETAARAEAIAKGKWAMVRFGATWSVACKEYEHETFPDLEVRRILDRDFVSIYVDASDDETPAFQRLQRKYDAKGVPAIFFFDPQGRERASVFEYQNPSQFTRTLRRTMASPPP